MPKMKMSSGQVGSSNPCTRRQFLAGSAAALGAFTIVPASVLGRDGSVPPSERIGLGVIGLGNRGSSHSGTLVNRSDVEIRAVCDPYQTKVDKLVDMVNKAYSDREGKKFQGCGGYQDFRELLARDDVDAIFVTAPEYWHGLIETHACRMGKDIYGEKALTLTVREGQKVIEAVRRYNRVFQTGTQQRSSGKFRFACELARNGYLGELQEVQVGVPGGRTLPKAESKTPPDYLDYEMWLGPAPWTPYNDQKCSYDWYFIYDYCVGWIQSWGVHHLDVALWGAPELHTGLMEVEGVADIPVEGLADTSVTWDVNLTPEKGPRLSFTDNRRNGQGCRFIGDKGWVHVNRGRIQAEPESLLRTQIKPNEVHLYESQDHHDNFFECIRSRRDPVSAIEKGHKSTVVSLIADIATRCGRKLTWNWDTETFVNDNAANAYLSRAMRTPWRM